MIILEGQISNQVIKGANGNFSVGNFDTEIGKFKIKSQLLDQFEEGDYQVRVSVTKLGLNTYVVNRTGITITEIIASINAIDVIEADIKPVTAEPTEPDASIDEQADKTARIEKVMDKPTSNKSSQTVEKGKTDPSNKKVQSSSNVKFEELDPPELFGFLWPLGNTVKLDTSLTRPQIIRQKEYLYSQGYSFELKTQIWSRS